MGTRRSRFAGGDQAYLKDEQYCDPSRLAATTNLHLAYGTASVPWFDWVLQTAALSPGSSVLEVGCGGGALWASDRGQRSELALTLVDLSAGMVSAALEHASSGSHLVADVQRLPFDDASFDAVVANHMLYHAPVPPSAVAGLARVVRPGGLVVAATNGARHLVELSEIRAAIFGTPLLDDTVTTFGIESGARMLEAVFEDVRWVDYPDELVCTEPADVLAYLRSLPPAEDATGEQVAALQDAVDARLRHGRGSMVITKETGLFLCRRRRET
jgi:SAM-dependent methyltransferase